MNKHDKIKKRRPCLFWKSKKDPGGKCKNYHGNHNKYSHQKRYYSIQSPFPEFCNIVIQLLDFIFAIKGNFEIGSQNLIYKIHSEESWMYFSCFDPLYGTYI